MSLPTASNRNWTRVSELTYYGRVSAVSGMLIEARGLMQAVSIGGQCSVTTTTGQDILCEVVGFRDGRALLMPFGKLEGIGPGLPRHGAR